MTRMMAMVPCSRPFSGKPGSRPTVGLGPPAQVTTLPVTITALEFPPGPGRTAKDFARILVGAAGHWTIGPPTPKELDQDLFANGGTIAEE